jgi:hypothetical protein
MVVGMLVIVMVVVAIVVVGVYWGACSDRVAVMVVVVMVPLTSIRKLTNARDARGGFLFFLSVFSTFLFALALFELPNLNHGTVIVMVRVVVYQRVKELHLRPGRLEREASLLTLPQHAQSGFGKVIDRRRLHVSRQKSTVYVPRLSNWAKMT